MREQSKATRKTLPLSHTVHCPVTAPPRSVWIRHGTEQNGTEFHETTCVLIVHIPWYVAGLDTDIRANITVPWVGNRKCACA